MVALDSLAAISVAVRTHARVHAWPETLVISSKTSVRHVAALPNPAAQTMPAAQAPRAIQSIRYVMLVVPKASPAALEMSAAYQRWLVTSSIPACVRFVAGWAKSAVPEMNALPTAGSLPVTKQSTRARAAEVKGSSAAPVTFATATISPVTLLPASAKIVAPRTSCAALASSALMVHLEEVNLHAGHPSFPPNAKRVAVPESPVVFPRTATIFPAPKWATPSAALKETAPTLYRTEPVYLATGKALLQTYSQRRVATNRLILIPSRLKLPMTHFAVARMVPAAHANSQRPVQMAMALSCGVSPIKKRPIAPFFLK